MKYFIFYTDPPTGRLVEKEVNTEDAMIYEVERAMETGVAYDQVIVVLGKLVPLRQVTKVWTVEVMR